MSYSFEYIDIILLAMIAGFIFLRLRGILGKKSGYEEDISASFPHDFTKKTPEKNLNANTFGEKEKKDPTMASFAEAPAGDVAKGTLSCLREGVRAIWLRGRARVADKISSLY